jgi:hypothetical protein
VALVLGLLGRVGDRVVVVRPLRVELDGLPVPPVGGLLQSIEDAIERGTVRRGRGDGFAGVATAGVAILGVTIAGGRGQRVLVDVVVVRAVHPMPHRQAGVDTDGREPVGEHVVGLHAVVADQIERLPPGEQVEREQRHLLAGGRQRDALRQRDRRQHGQATSRSKTVAVLMLTLRPAGLSQSSVSTVTR